jgi:hypothetical protein
MNWNWYSARPNELFIDIDRFEKSKKHIERRLQGAIESMALKIQSVFIFPSLRPDHKHMIVVLRDYIPDYERYAWEMLFHGDIYRACANIMRSSRGVKHPDVLISRLYLHREPDARCNCESKHNRVVMEKCVTALRLREKYGVSFQFFGCPSRENPIWKIR